MVAKKELHIYTTLINTVYDVYVCVVPCVCRQDFPSAVDVDVVPPIDRPIYYIFIFSLCDWRW